MAEKIGITFTGLDELMKACEECASEAELAKTNRKIVEKSTEIVKSAMQKRIPVSADNAKSGREGSRPGGHARPNVPVSGIKISGTEASAEVGWKLSDTSEYFYMKFVNWGTTKMPPREFVKSAIDEVEGEITEIARAKYEELLKAKIGG